MPFQATDSMLVDNAAHQCDVLVLFCQIPSQCPHPANFDSNWAILDDIFKVSLKEACRLKALLDSADAARRQDFSVLDGTVFSDPSLQCNGHEIDTLTNLSSTQASASDDESAPAPTPTADPLERQLLKQTALLGACNARRRAADARIARLEEELAEARALVDWHLSRAAQFGPAHKYIHIIRTYFRDTLALLIPIKAGFLHRDIYVCIILHIHIYHACAESFYIYMTYIHILSHIYIYIYIISHYMYSMARTHVAT